MRNVISNQAQRHCYDAGREACSRGKDKSPPGGLGAQRRSYWLAGYNDRDIELQAQARLVAFNPVTAVPHDEMRAKFSIIGIEKMPPMEYDEL